MKIDAICEVLAKAITDKIRLRKSVAEACKMRLQKSSSGGKDWHWVELKVAADDESYGKYVYTVFSSPPGRTPFGAKWQFIKSYCNKHNIGSVEELMMTLIAKGYAI